MYEYIKKITPGGKQNLSIYPNPSKDDMVLKIDLNQTAQVKIELYNVLGERVYTLLNDTRLTSGRQSFRIRKTDVNGVPGIYIIKCAVGDVIYNERIIFTD